jgi:hypothetical protein
VIQVGGGEHYSTALRRSGEVVAWGNNGWQQTNVPERARSNVVEISPSASRGQTALLGSGEVLFWGDSSYGQNNVPDEAKQGIVAVSAGSRHSMALTAAGEVLVWGDNQYGQTSVPTDARSEIRTISAGGYHSLALTKSGRVVAWGDNGNGATTVPAECNSGIMAIAGGDQHSLALTVDGKVLAWGNPLSGATTVPLAALSGVIQIAAGGESSYALKEDGTILAWGRGAEGQLNVPATYQNSYLSVRGGYHHSLAIIPGTPPVITTPSTLIGTVGVPLEYSVTASGTAPITYSAFNLPASLTINTNSGLISGTPTAAGSGTATITASNAFGTTNQIAAFVIAKGTPVISATPTASPINYGQALSESILSGGTGSMGEVSTLAGSGTAGFADGNAVTSQYNFPRGVAVDLQGNVYVADSSNNRIRKMTSAGIVTTLAGSGVAGFADGVGAVAQFKNPRGIAVDSLGNVYVGDYENNRIRKVTPEGVVTTLAGSGTRGYVDGIGVVAQFSRPYGVALDSSGNLYVAENDNRGIRKVTPEGTVTTLAGTVGQFLNPNGVAVDFSGNVYVADWGSHRICKVTQAGVVTTLAGSGTIGFANGTGTAAQFNQPTAIAVDAVGNVYVADQINNCIRKVTPEGLVTTMAGSGIKGFADGTVTEAKFDTPRGVAVDSSGNLYVGDTGNNRIRKVTPSFGTWTFASPSIVPSAGISTQTVVFTPTDTANYNTVTASVSVVALSDSQAPLISLLGANPLEIFKGTSFTDPGAMVTDNVDATRTITGSGTVNTGTVGIYTLNYTAQDLAGNLALPETRTVNVVLDPAGDEDGDGATNEEELAAGTDPYDSASGPSQPVAFGDAFTAKLAAGMTTKVTTASLISNDKYSGIPSETRGVTFESTTGTSTGGGSIRVKGGWVIYQPSPTAQNGTTDTFIYTVTNGTKTATGTVTVSLVAPDYVAEVAFDRKDGNKVYFSVMPGMTFEVQGSDLTPPVTWSTILNGSSNYWTSGADGRLIVTDPEAVLAPRRFYRLKWIP